RDENAHLKPGVGFEGVFSGLLGSDLREALCGTVELAATFSFDLSFASREAGERFRAIAGARSRMSAEKFADVIPLSSHCWSESETPDSLAKRLSETRISAPMRPSGKLRARRAR